MSDESSKKESNVKEVTDRSNSLLVKAVAGVFATVLAPVLVAMGMKFSDVFVNKLTDPSSPKSNASADHPDKVPSPADSASTTPGSRSVERSTAMPPASGNVVRLFNHKDLTGFYTYVSTPAKKGGSPIGKNKDPNEVFTVVNGELRISGQNYGTLLTKKQYENYHLTVEFRWGEKAWPPRESKARNSGILLHANGPEGAHKGLTPQATACQIMEGAVGDLILYPGDVTPPLSVSVEAEKQASFTYRPGEPLTTFSSGSIKRLGNTADWQDVLGFSRPGDVERPAGEWNVLECTCQADRITIWLNGKVVNAAVNVSPRKGKIGFQSEAAEIFFRKIHLQPIATN